MAEEVNRRMLDHMAQLLLCPTPGCVRNVRSEHVLARGIFYVGDTMYDSLLKLMPKVKASDAPLKYGLPRRGYAFMTLHRAETVDNPGTLREVIGAVGALPVTVAFSVHPRTKARMKEFGISPGPNIELLEPLPYIETLGMVDGSELVITDSGGLQKEAFWLGKPSLIARDTTEWGEIVKAGGAFLVGTSPSRFRLGYAKSLRVGTRPFARSKRIFGVGHASAKVVRAVSSFLREGGRDKSWK
jgi:UDP-N-acetylglucosamine 2-epimerase